MTMHELLDTIEEESTESYRQGLTTSKSAATTLVLLAIRNELGRIHDRLEDIASLLGGEPAEQ